MDKTLLDESIDILDISDKINKLLKDNNISIIKELCCKTKTDLKNLGLFTHQITEIEIALQLKGLDLNIRRY